jgi:hypothetical protein
LAQAPRRIGSHSLNVDAAFRYAAKGWPVFPCRGKIPLTPHGFRNASMDAATIEAWNLGAFARRRDKSQVSKSDSRMPRRRGETSMIAGPVPGAINRSNDRRHKLARAAA